MEIFKQPFQHQAITPTWNVDHIILNKLVVLQLKWSVVPDLQMHFKDRNC